MKTKLETQNKKCNILRIKNQMKNKTQNTSIKCNFSKFNDQVKTRTTQSLFLISSKTNDNNVENLTN